MTTERALDQCVCVTLLSRWESIGGTELNTRLLVVEILPRQDEECSPSLLDAAPQGGFQIAARELASGNDADSLLTRIASNPAYGAHFVCVVARCGSPQALRMSTAWAALLRKGGASFVVVSALADPDLVLEYIPANTAHAIFCTNDPVALLHPARILVGQGWIGADAADAIAVSVGRIGWVEARRDEDLDPIASFDRARAKLAGAPAAGFSLLFQSNNGDDLRLEERNGVADALMAAAGGDIDALVLVNQPLWSEAGIAELAVLCERAQ